MEKSCTIQITFKNGDTETMVFSSLRDAIECLLELESAWDNITAWRPLEVI